MVPLTFHVFTFYATLHIPMPTLSQWRLNRRRISFAPPLIQNLKSKIENAESSPLPNLTRFFDAAWCISLDSDSTRWRDFQTQLASCDWPFCPVTRFPAIDGDVV